MKKVLFASIALILSACSDEYSIPKATVMITNPAGNSGGSGSILSHSKTKSTVLTNAHVCKLAEKTAIVHSILGGSHPVVSYQVSKQHDLCLMTVAADLGASSPISFESPHFLDPLTVSGHPKLLPLILSTGHLSGKQVIEVMTGTRSCSEAEWADPNTGLFCMILGGLPLIRSYEAVAVSALIQPGSSGSGIYNANREIIAVAFAGGGDIGYGFAVPYEYVVNFLRVELPSLPVEVPNPVRMFANDSSRSSRAYSEQLKKLCSETINTSGTEEQKNFCDHFLNSISLD